MIRASLVDTSALLKVIWVSLVAGIGVTAAFSLIVFGATRGAEARRAGHGPAALFYLLAVVAVLACVWALWQGWNFVVTKG